jgi:hypothetical protein
LNLDIVSAQSLSKLRMHRFFFPAARAFIVGAAAFVASCVREQTSEVTLTRLDDRVRVEINGAHFTDYIFQGASRPFCYPILMPDGVSLVRDFPMKKTAGEDDDHPHQRALMFAHGNANEIDFWNEGTAGSKFPKGITAHDGIIAASDGAVGELRVRNRWHAPSGELIATDETMLRFHGDAESGARFLDYEVTIHALPDRPLVMGDIKDGTMAIRVAQWMTLPHRHRGQDIPGAGHLLTAAGHRDSEAWGKRAAWCTYYAEHAGKTYGVALFDHPQNLRHPTWWMARDYGLLAANPFGRSMFESTKENPLPPDLGRHTIPAGGSLTLRYRFYFYFGDPDSAQIAQHYANYIAGS